MNAENNDSGSEYMWLVDIVCVGVARKFRISTEELDEFGVADMAYIIRRNMTVPLYILDYMPMCEYE